ncbi:hypothetical protein COV82_02100, partial [Candidatus Peregrinibacteria bacterium CG11_big_fil_rev_8_21_14_0_20_46_8]
PAPAGPPPGGMQQPSQPSPAGTPSPMPPPPPGTPAPAGVPPAPHVPGSPPPMGQTPMPPAGGIPQGGTPAGGNPPPPPPPPSPPANFQLGQLIPQDLKIKVPAHSLQFDEQYFLRLLAGSISLTKDEKKRIIESIPKLRQEQIDELVRIFEEEKRKFAELGQEHVPQLEKLARQHAEEWKDLEMGEEQQVTASKDEEEAEKLRKQMGLQ